jgi:hypothetical protein
LFVIVAVVVILLERSTGGRRERLGEIKVEAKSRSLLSRWQREVITRLSHTDRVMSGWRGLGEL